ncbi:PREDICTED: uncharacterized protein LOC109233701 [Nicotiana attenuata]|uniref:uncharacterized protein LOC109233701 n=1 Tax=Nicotiana attenuata TaxID=49451 RepID=UPI000904D88A|nr:PREDICTED: uncharacterized protein LOC109233701 [Nicotiana attenuata]
MVNSTPDSSSSSPAYTPEPSSPLFLLPFDVSSVSLVVVPFSGSSFGGWRRSMIVSQSARNKIGFIDGSCTKPVVNSPQYRQWDRCNNMVISWLINSLSPDIAESVQYFETAESIWKQLNNRYGTVNGTKQHLNDATITIPDTVYNILLQDEKQRQVVPNTQLNPESASFNASSNINRFPSQLSFTKQYTQRVNFDSISQKSNITLSCKYCKKPGHTIEKCYKLHGFPSNFKFTKGKKFSTTASAEGKTSEPSAMYSPTDQSSLIPGLTKEQCSQLMQLLSQSILGESGSQPVLMGSANFAGSTSSLPVCLNGSSTVRMLTSVAGRVWIVDSGATDYMTSNKDLLFNITPLPVPYLVSLPNGYKVKVTCTGSLTMLPSFTLHSVLYIPSFHYNLISVSKAHSMKKLLELGRIDQGLYKFHLNHPAPPTSPNNSVSLFTNEVQSAEFSLHGNAQNVNYNSAPVSPCATIQNEQTENSCYVSTLPSCTVPNNVNKNDVLWHHRLGHVPFVQMKHIPSISNDLSAKQSFICHLMTIAEQHGHIFYTPRAMPSLYLKHS